MTRSVTAVAICAAIGCIAGNCEAAIILPAIEGRVFHDANGSGQHDVGEELSDVAVELYVDDGDGIFHVDDDTLVPTMVLTGDDGRYLFEGLSLDEQYFVRRASQVVDGQSNQAEVSSLLRPGQPSMLIDTFDRAQSILANPHTPSATNSLSNPNVLGGERDLHLSLRDGLGTVELRSNAFGVKVLQYDNAAGVRGEAIVTWDGVDHSADPTPSLGLGGVDLTDGGKNEGLLLKLGIDASGAGEHLRLRIYGNSVTEFSEASTILPVTDGTAAAMAFVPFDQFLGPVTADEVNAVQLILGGGAKSVDAQVDFFGALGTVQQDFLLVPEPSSAVTLLLGWAAYIACRTGRQTTINRHGDIRKATLRNVRLAARQRSTESITEIRCE